MINRLLSLFAIALFLVACASEESGGGDPRPDPTAVPVEFYVTLPNAEGTRTGDPGAEQPENVDWDRLTVIVAYKQKTTDSNSTDANPQKMVYWDTFTRDEFRSLTAITHPSSTLTPIMEGSADTGVRTFTMPLPPGIVRIYGVTYSSPSETDNDAQKNYLIDFETRLSAIAVDGADHNADILAWQIPNSYATTNGSVATMDVAKFLSVATGYAVNSKPGVTSPYDLTVAKANDVEMKQYWSMTLHRLATKLDMQWDAQSAYDNPDQTYVDVAVDAFAYNGGASLADGDLGSGLVFPYTAIQPAGATFAPLGGKVTFRNTSPISKRNGRAYHYFFSDLSPSARLDFDITADTRAADGSTSTSSRNFSYSLSTNAPLLPATWYKINTKIRGNQRSNNVISAEFNTGN